MRVEDVIVEGCRVVSTAVSAAVDGRECSRKLHESAGCCFYGMLQCIRGWAVVSVVRGQRHIVDSGFCVEMDWIHFCTHLAIAKVPKEFNGRIIRKVDKLHRLVGYDHFGRAIHKCGCCRREYFDCAIVNHFFFLAFEANDREGNIVRSRPREYMNRRFL